MTSLNDLIDNKIKLIINKYKSDLYSYSTTIKNLVLSGGGTKGIAHIGALKALEENGLLKNIKNIIGTSIGGIVAGLYCIGYTPDDLLKFIELFDINKIRGVNPSQFLTNFGVDDGAKLNLFLEKMFISKNISINITFSELFKKTGYNLILTSTCLNDKNIYYFSHELTPNMQILLAMKMTSAFPLWFYPITYQNKLFVDGGCIDNYPIRFFQNDLNSTIGIYLSNEKNFLKNINNIEEYFNVLIDCLCESLTNNLLKDYEKYTIKIDIKFIGIIDLNINNIIKKQIYLSGYNSTISFLKINKFI